MATAVAVARGGYRRGGFCISLELVTRATSGLVLQLLLISPCCSADLSGIVTDCFLLACCTAALLHICAAKLLLISPCCSADLSAMHAMPLADHRRHRHANYPSKEP